MTARDTTGDRMRRMSPRRRQILDTAADLFAARGFHGVSMGDIGAAVGISGPALYKHFAGKEDILGQCLLHASQRLLDGARALAATPGRDGERTSTGTPEPDRTRASTEPSESSPTRTSAATPGRTPALTSPPERDEAPALAATPEPEGEWADAVGRDVVGSGVVRSGVLEPGVLGPGGGGSGGDRPAGDGPAGDGPGDDGTGDDRPAGDGPGDDGTGDDGTKGDGPETENAPADALTGLIAFHTDFALAQPSLIVVQEREWGALGERVRAQVRERQLAYVEVWTRALGPHRPDLSQAQARAAVQAAFGLLNSTPHSARISRTAMRRLLVDMARAALLPA